MECQMCYQEVTISEWFSGTCPATGKGHRLTWQQLLSVTLSPEVGT